MIKVVNYTKKPIQLMGKIAGCCYGSDTKTQEKNFKRGMKCIEDGHGRVMEYADVVLEIDEYSARAIRELYVHIIGTSRVQASTRYINYGSDNFKYYIPESIEKDAACLSLYKEEMNYILHTYNDLIQFGIPKEDAANLLPLGLFSKVVLKINLRALLHFAEMRLCARAYKEIQDMCKEMIDVISEIDDEWKVLMGFMKPKCKICTEKQNCPKLKNK